MKEDPGKKEINTEACHGVELLVSTHPPGHPPTFQPTVLHGWECLQPPRFKTLHWSWLLGHLVAMDKVMPVVGGVASLWAASKIIPVMYLCSTYSDGSPYTWMMQNVAKGFGAILMLRFPWAFEAPLPQNWHGRWTSRRESRQTNK